jgi:lysophospholipase L1-like esterase
VFGQEREAPAFFANLPKIVSKLRKAAGKKVPMAGMTYYDPFLAGYLMPTTSPLATLSVSLATSLNSQLTKIYQAQKFKVADVGAAFKTSDMTDLGTFAGQAADRRREHLQRHLNMRARPAGPEHHANVAGYALIAQTFAAAVGKL